MWEQISAPFPGTCDACGDEFSAGDKVWVDTDQPVYRAHVRCDDCGSGDTNGTT